MGDKQHSVLFVNDSGEPTIFHAISLSRQSSSIATAVSQGGTLNALIARLNMAEAVFSDGQFPKFGRNGFHLQPLHASTSPDVRGLAQ